MESVEVVLKKEKETKNTVKYCTTDTSKPQPIDTLYVKKWFAGGASQIKLTIQEA